MRSSILAIALVAAATVVAGVAAEGPPGYDDLPAAMKQAYLWAKLTADETSQPWYPPSKFANFFKENMNVTFDTASDFMPPSHVKYIHTEGYVAKFRFMPAGNQSYTGGYAGSDYGIARFSFANEPTSAGIIPATAWKFLRDGVPSGNMFAMFGAFPLPTFGYFDTVFTNMLPAPPPNPAGNAVANLFHHATRCAHSLGATNVANVNQDGSAVPSPSSPFKIILVPNEAIAFPNKASNLDNWPTLFESIPVGSKLYDVRAMRYPDSAEPELIGHLVSDSQIVPSLWGDQTLFFQHERLETAAAAHPEWAGHGIGKVMDAACIPHLL